ncbi:hypothetical protein Glove_148g5 [Diversispora epigaea]|uniref:Uncharacterized protein n=1 Tax=Diversispora epigaea TaxID=1348612 RepID=A0A397J3C2_9GLOM|nr:hypothetical protein Glove_148g5 [Diversispora epigaea]
MQDQIILRNHENMMEHFNNNTGHSVSLEPVENYFWNIPNLNIYAATVPDRMHHLDLGLYHYQIEFTKGILGRSSIDKMNERIGAIPRYPGLKIFSKGLQSIARLTTSEHRDLMKVMVFVVDGLLSNDLSEVYVKWNEMIPIFVHSTSVKESDLEKFQKAINEWADLFVILFRKKSDSKMKFPKFHSWIFHIVDTIREYGAINGYTTETYESLHKSYVKTPYRLSNKKGIEEQIMKTIRRKAIIKRRVTEELHKTPTALIYTSKLFEFKLLEASIFFEQQKKNPDLTENMIKGFAKFLECLDLFFDMLDIISAEDCRIKIFGSVTLKNINILRATNKFQNRPWFSNIAIAMDDAELFEYQSDNGTCYAQTLLITEVILPNKSPFHLALVQWYDFKSKNTPFVYGCPLLKLVEIYNFIEIEAIEEIVHIVPRFDTKDEYFTKTGVTEIGDDDDDAPFTRKEAKIFFNELKKEISDVRKLLEISGVGDYTTEESFIKEFVGEIASYSINKYIYPNKKELKKSAGAISAKSYPEYFEHWEDDRWSYYYSKYIHSRLLAKHRSRRGAIATRVKDVLRKLNQDIDGHENLTWCTKIMEKIWEKSKKVLKEKVAFTISIIQYLLSPKVESIKIDDEAIRKRMKKNIKKLEKGETIEFEEKSDEESESEEESEEESSEEEEKKGKERRELTVFYYQNSTLPITLTQPKGLKKIYWSLRRPGNTTSNEDFTDSNWRPTSSKTNILT